MTYKRLRKICLGVTALLPLAAGALYAQADTAARYESWWLPAQASAEAARIDDLFNLILWITSVVFVLVFALMIFFLIRYRRGADGRAVYSHGNNKLEIAWTISPALILVFLAVMSQSLWSDIKQNAPGEENSLVIEVKPRQFQWDVRYAGADGSFDTEDDITAINQVHVPSGKDVIIKMTAQDVIHSFFVPEFRMKQDAVPGLLTRFWFKADTTGQFEIACAELCGLGHYRMRGFLNILTPSEFDAWYAGEQEKMAAQLAPPPASEPSEPGDGDAEAEGAGADTSAAGAADAVQSADTAGASGPTPADESGE